MGLQCFREGTINDDIYRLIWEIIIELHTQKSVSQYGVGLMQPARRLGMELQRFLMVSGDNSSHAA